MGLHSLGHGLALRVAEDQDQLRLQCASAKFQAAHDASFRVRAAVARVPQHEEVARHCVEDSLQGSSGICAADDRCVRCLALLQQHLPHVSTDFSGQRLPNSKALVAFLQKLQRLLRLQGSISCGANRQGRHGGWKRLPRSQQFCLPRRLAEKLHPSGGQVVDRALDLQLFILDVLPKGLTVFQEEVHRVENVHLHCVRGKMVELDAGA
mmetsp:Transcript_6897/g.15988  ORF Transcript_6897/g.15988 Transcript_6897/m.15988 type:complete len:209 (-) Transcript_6897:426-1052(-)